MWPIFALKCDKIVILLLGHVWSVIRLIEVQNCIAVVLLIEVVIKNPLGLISMLRCTHFQFKDKIRLILVPFVLMSVELINNIENKSVDLMEKKQKLSKVLFV